MSDAQSWWSRRWEAFLDNAIFYCTVALLTAVIAAGVFGNDVTSIALWVVTLFAGLQIATIAAVIVLFRRLSDKPRVEEVVEVEPAPPPKHPHAGLLARIDALRGSLADLDPMNAVAWPAANAFNQILREAIRETDHMQLHNMDEFTHANRFEEYADSGDNGAAITMLDQIKAIVQHSE